jgi:membrane fusion protein, multidrug efflux system
MHSHQHVRLLFLGCVAAGALTLAGCGNQAQQGGMPGPMPVTVVTLKAEPVTLTRELPGRTSAYLVAEVRPQVTGIVKQRLFTEGGTVKAGQTLYELDDAIYRAAYNNAQAALAKAKATLVVAQSTARRSAELAKIDAVSAQDNENAIAALSQSEADVAAAEAAVAGTGVNLGYTRITSPINGRIGISSVTQGALVTANQTTALATVQQLDPIYVDVSQSSSEWLQLKEAVDAGRLESSGSGTPASISLENGSKYPQMGKLQFADVTVDPTTGSFLLRVLVPNPKNTLMPGMYVKALLNEGERKQAVLAPQQGITRDPKGDATALVVGVDSKVEPRKVKVSRTIGDQWLVEEGLQAGDKVIVEGVQKVQPGMPVQATEAGATPTQPPAASASSPTGK